MKKFAQIFRCYAHKEAVPVSALNENLKYSLDHDCLNNYILVKQER
jgi:hypothetical protein